jgi:hypothetical protein
MKPIGQTFFVNAPATGVPGVYITRVDLFFKSISTVFGIELQIRTTSNGVPTPERLPFASKTIYPYTGPTPPPVTTPNVPFASDNASIPTSFIFDTPIFVQAGTSYALVLLSLGDNPDYKIWTAEIGQTDTITGTPIYENNQIGDLFISSNDISWEPNINEDMKFIIYTAEFTASSGSAIFRSPNEDYLELDDVVGTYQIGEPLYVANDKFNIAVLQVSGLSGTFTAGDYVYQSNGSANTAYGYVYDANNTVIKVQNTSAAFVSSNTVFNTSSVSNAYVTGVSQNASIVAGSNSFSVPDTSIFSINDKIYIGKSNFSNSQIVKVTAITNNTTLAFSNAFVNGANTSNFTDTNCVYGKLRHNGTLTAGFGSTIVYPDFQRAILDNVTSTEANNFVGAIGKRLIGRYSGASSLIHDVIDVPYNQISPQMPSMAPSNTGINWSFTGFKNDINYTIDPGYTRVREGASNEQIDYERIFVSRSRELTSLPIGRIGNRSVKIKADMYTANNKISPVIDTISHYSHFTLNLCVPEYELSGAYLNIQNANGKFSNGAAIYQGGVSGTVRFANSSYVRVTNISNGMFTANNTTIVGSPATVNALISTSIAYSESKDNGYFRSSRYISKNVVLASSQNSEDILVFLAAYRPTGTNLKVYTKIQNEQDPELYDDKEWSLLSERTSPSLLSSRVNVDDLIELSYSFPQSVNISPNNNICDLSSNSVTINGPYSTADLDVGDYVYLTDGDNKKFIVRKISSIPNSNTIVLESKPSFSSSNIAVGVIPGLISQSGAFLNDRNNFIVRYVTPNDLVFDTYTQFSIKIVPVSTTTAVVPRVADMRVIAIQS